MYYDFYLAFNTLRFISKLTQSFRLCLYFKEAIFLLYSTVVIIFYYVLLHLFSVSVCVSTE